MSLNSYDNGLFALVVSLNSYDNGLFALVVSLNSYDNGLFALVVSLNSYDNGLLALVVSLNSYDNGLICVGCESKQLRQWAICVGCEPKQLRQWAVCAGCEPEQFRKWNLYARREPTKNYVTGLSAPTMTPSDYHRWLLALMVRSKKKYIFTHRCLDIRCKNKLIHRNTTRHYSTNLELLLTFRNFPHTKEKQLDAVHRQLTMEDIGLKYQVKISSNSL